MSVLEIYLQKIKSFLEV